MVILNIMEKVEFVPDRIDSCLGFADGSPKTKALAGYHMLRLIHGILIVHSGVIFAGIITFEALRLTDCLSDDDGGGGGCGNAESVDNSSNEPCTKLWGLMKADSLLTTIATVASIFVAVFSAFLGTAMDFSPYRKKIGTVGVLLCIFGVLLCATIVDPTEVTIAICSFGLFLVFVFKDVIILTIDCFAPELSEFSYEVATAIATGYLWLYSTEVGGIIFFVVIGLFISSTALYGLVVSLAVALMIAVIFPVCFDRLPNVRAARDIPSNFTFIQFTVFRLRALMGEVRKDFPDLGLLIASNMIFDPALNTLFIAAVLLLVSKYKFSASEVSMLLGLAICCAIPGALVCKWVCSTKILDSLFVESPTNKAYEVRLREVEVEMVVADNSTGIEVGVDNSTGIEDGAGNSTGIEASFMTHPSRMKYSLIFGLLATCVTTACGALLMQPCAFPLGCVFGGLWGFWLAWCWNSATMLRAALVPGGSEAEFSGLASATTSAFSWLPSLIFTVSNELWTLTGAMLVMNVFFIAGALIVACMDIDRAVKARHHTLELRRWAL